MPSHRPCVPSEDQTPVTTRVPASQKAAWAADADALDMSQAEFVRTMVQAGRRELELPEGVGAATAAGAEGGERDGVEPDSPGPNPGGEALEDRVLDVLQEEGVCSWDELVEAFVGDFEDELDETLTRLQSEGPVSYSGREGGYVVRE